MGKLSKSKIMTAPKGYNDLFYVEMPILKKYIRSLFPQEAAVREHVAHLPAREKAPKNVYTAQYLPYHFKDIPWMTEYVTETMERLAPDHKFEPYTIQSMVSGYGPFRNARYAYKQRLIKAQIQYMLTAQEANGIMSDGVTPASLRAQPDYDKAFRAELANAMTKLGVEPNFIEIGLETNADLWRRQTMLQTFENRYYPQGSADPNKIKQEHCIKWLKNREHEYYQEHKDIVEKWGFETRAMRMDERQARENKAQANYFNNVREEWLLSHPRATETTDREM